MWEVHLIKFTAYSKDDLNAEDWVVFKTESVYDESVDKNRRKTNNFQIDVKTGKG